jgi:hypothetical protein
MWQVGAQEKGTQSTGGETYGSDQLEDIGINVRIILKWILKI